MKKVSTITGLAVSLTLSSHAQGYVLFSSSTQNISTNGSSFSLGTGKTEGVGNYYYALFWSSTITNGAALQGTTNLSAYAFNTSGWTADTDPTAAAASTGTAGRFAATNPNSDGSTTVPGIIGGNSYYFTVVGWSANLGSTLAAMEASLPTLDGYIGQSAVSGLIQTGNGGGISPEPIMGSLAPEI